MTLAARRTIALAVALLVAALTMLAFAGTPARAATVGAQLTLHGIASATSPDGAPVLNVAQGDTVVFTPGPPPARANAALLSYWVTLDSAALPSGPDSVKLGQHATYSMTFPSTGSFVISWTPSNTLGRLPLKSGEYTNATIIVSDPVPSQPSTSGEPTDPPQSSSSAPGSTPSPSSSHGVLGASASRGRLGSTSGNFHGPAGDNGSVSFGTGVAPVVGFGPPASDGTSRGTVPSDVASSDPVPSADASNAAATSVSPPSRPTALAVVAILVLAVVCALAAYLYFVPNAVQRLLVR